MKSPYHFFILCSLLILLFTSGCGPSKPGVWQNAQIAAGLKNDFHSLNDQAFKDLKANDLKHLRNMMSQELLENTYMARQVDLISYRLHTPGYHILDEYYIVNKYKQTDTIMSKATGINAYDLYYTGVAKEMYMAFFVPKAVDDQWMITLVYAKYSYGWKLSNIDLSPYTHQGKTAPELFKLAKEDYGKKYLVDAVNTMVLASDCAHPNDLWKYKQDYDISYFYGQLVGEANAKYKFPFVIKEVATQPRIFRIYNQSYNGATYPMIYYKTSIKLKDTVALKKEQLAMKKVIGKLIPGIDKNKKYLLYAAFNEIPNGTKSVNQFDINDKLK